MQFAARVPTVNKRTTYTHSSMPEFPELVDTSLGVFVSPVFGASECGSMAKRILVADDSALMRRQIRTLLELDTDIEVCRSSKWVGSRAESSEVLSRLGCHGRSDAGNEWIRSDARDKKAPAISAGSNFYA